MSKSNLHENAYLKLVFQNIAMDNIGDASGIQPSAIAGNLFLALYTTDPGETDAGIEATYTGYARVPVPRSVAGWLVVDNIVTNAGDILFPVSAGASNVIMYWGVKTALVGGDLVGSGPLTGSITVEPGDTPRFVAGLVTIIEQ